MTVFDTYSEADIATWLGQRELEKGRAYVRATSDLQLEGELLTAQVQGTVRLPYRVAIRINPHPLAGRTLLSSCSCPVGGSCKHVAATLIAWLNRRRDPNRPREQVLAWVTHSGPRQVSLPPWLPAIPPRPTVCAT